MPGGEDAKGFNSLLVMYSVLINFRHSFIYSSKTNQPTSGGVHSLVCGHAHYGSLGDTIYPLTVCVIYIYVSSTLMQYIC